MNEQSARLFVVGVLCLVLGLIGGYNHGKQSKQPYIDSLIVQRNDANDTIKQLTAPLAIDTTPVPVPIIPPPETTSVPTNTCGPHGCDAMGCPKNQYVNGYTRPNGTVVQGYWRNSPNDNC